MHKYGGIFFSMGTYFQRSKNSVLRATQSTVLHTKIQLGFQYLIFWHLPIVCTLCLFISLICYWQEELRTLILNLIWESESLSSPATACPWITATIRQWFIFTYSAWRLHCICFLLFFFLTPRIKTAINMGHQQGLTADPIPITFSLSQCFTDYFPNQEA